MALPEYTEVELPLVEHLKRLKWTHILGSTADPSASGRESFREVLLRVRLSLALRRINPGPDGEPWLDDKRVSEAIASLERVSAGKLIEANQQVTQVLLEGISVP